MSRILLSVAGLIVVIGLTAWATTTMVAVDGEEPVSKIRGYEVTARFDNVGHLKVGAVVAAAGVQVGQVRDIRYDFESYEAVVTMVVEDRYDRFPADTSASILTTGFVGEQYIGLQPGADERSLRDGDQLDITSSALILEQIIGQFLYNMAQDDKEPRGVAGPAVTSPGF